MSRSHPSCLFAFYFAQALVVSLTLRRQRQHRDLSLLPFLAPIVADSLDIGKVMR